jgi:hypothetical protein
MAIRLLVAVVVALLGPLGAVSIAHADTSDDKFLAALKSDGITDHISPNTRSRPVIQFVRNLTTA